MTWASILTLYLFYYLYGLVWTVSMEHRQHALSPACPFFWCES